MLITNNSRWWQDAFNAFAFNNRILFLYFLFQAFHTFNIIQLTSAVLIPEPEKNFMYKFFIALAFFIIPTQGSTQVLPKEGGKLHYRIIGFSFPKISNKNSYTIQIAKGNYNTVDSFKKNVTITLNSRKNKIVAEVPAFGTAYTWRVVYHNPTSSDTAGGLNHFSTNYIKLVDTNNTRLRIIRSAVKYKDAYVFLDGTKTLYDMKGNPVWSLPDINGVGAPPRDLKLTPQKTITFLLDNHAYEINYDCDILWKSPNDGKVSGTLGEGYNHEFTRLRNGHYMVLGKKPFLWELPTTIDSSVLNAPGEIIVHDTIAKKYYQKMEFGTVIEYDTSGKVLWSWNPSEYLKNSDLYYRRTLEGLFDLDVHENSFFFDEHDQVIYLSFRDVSRVLKIKYPEGNVLASYGGAYKPGNREVQKGLFCHQHSCRFSEDGYLYLYNNNGCNPNERPKVIMMKEQGGAKDSLKKVWEYECDLPGMNEKTPIDPAFMAGGNVLELPDHSLFVSMCVLYGNVFIISKDKKILWNAISEIYNPAKKKWKVQASYRASIITHKDLEDLVWKEE